MGRGIRAAMGEATLAAVMAGGNVQSTGVHAIARRWEDLAVIAMGMTGTTWIHIKDQMRRFRMTDAESRSISQQEGQAMLDRMNDRFKSTVTQIESCPKHGAAQRG